MNFITIAALFSFIIIIHEFGHLVFARLAGVQVLSFNIGFGPILWSKTYKQTEYALRLLPLGGAVQLAGLDGEYSGPATFRYDTKRPWQKLCILSAGSVLNIVLAFVIFTVLVMLHSHTWNVFQASFKAGFLTAKFSKEFALGFISLFSGQGLAQVAGPVGILKMSSEVAQLGQKALLFFFALLSLNIGFLNLLPFPALDGGRIVFVLFELVSGKTVPPKYEQYVHAIGFMLLLALIGVVTFSDLQKL